MAKVNLTKLYKALEDKPLHEQYDPGNEPLEIQYHGDQQLYYIEAEDIEAYVNGETVFAADPDRGGDDVEVNRENSDVTGVSEEELEDFMASSRGDQFIDNLNEDFDEDKVKKAIINILKKEGGAAGLKPILAIAKKLGATKNQIKKVLNSIGKIKKHTDGDYILTPINEKDPAGHWNWKERLKRLFGLGEEQIDEMLEAGCSEQEIIEGTCGYGEDGVIGNKPAGPDMLSENFKNRLQKLANIKK